MNYLVDAGKIERMRSTSPRDAVMMMLTMWDGDAAWPIDVYTEATGERATFIEGACNVKVYLRLGRLNRWYVAHIDCPSYAWSGSRWARHSDGLPTGTSQVSNFDSRDEAEAYAKMFGFVVIEETEAA